MRYRLLLLAFMASMGTAALAQHAGHAPQHAAPTKPVAEPDKSPKAPPAARPGTGPAATPAFEGYRPYNPQEPAKAWRAANEEVREAGGHVGIARSAQGAGSGEAGRK